MRIELRYVAGLSDDQIGLLGGLRLGPTREDALVDGEAARYRGGALDEGAAGGGLAQYPEDAGRSLIRVGSYFPICPV